MQEIGRIERYVLPRMRYAKQELSSVDIDENINGVANGLVECRKALIPLIVQLEQENELLKSQVDGLEKSDSMHRYGFWKAAVFFGSLTAIIAIIMKAVVSSR